MGCRALRGQISKKRVGESMKLLAPLFWLGLLLSMDPYVSRAEPAAGSAAGTNTVLAIYTEDCGLGSAGEPQLVLAVWGDGRIVWSDDRLHGGSPYHAARIAPVRLHSLLSKFERDGLFAEKSLAQLEFRSRFLLHDNSHPIWEEADRNVFMARTGRGPARVGGNRCWAYCPGRSFAI